MENVIYALLTIRRQATEALASLGVHLEDDGEGAPVTNALSDLVGGECPHPADRRLAAGVMGSPSQFFCRACNRLVNPDVLEVSDAAARDHRE